SPRYRLDVAVCEAAHGFFGVRTDYAPPPRTVDAVEGVGLYRLADAPHLRGGQRDVVREAVHEAHIAAVAGHGEDVAAEHRAAPIRAARPVEHRPPGEVPAQPDERHAVAQVEGIARPVLHGVIRAHDPLAAGFMQVDRRVERV